jgi:hypothetical protein
MAAGRVALMFALMFKLMFKPGALIEDEIHR